MIAKTISFNFILIIVIELVLSKNLR